MGHWKEAVVTDDGVEMLNEWMAGRKITITSAYGGTGTVDADRLAEQTGLMDLRQKLCLIGEEDGPEGKTVQIQVVNTELEQEYELNQVGVYAALDKDRNPDAEERLLFLMQDKKGVTIPASSDAGFLLELYCAIGITNNGRFEVSVSAAGVVTVAYLRKELEREFAVHNAERTAHGGMAGRLAALEIAMNGNETICQEGAPTPETAGVKGQHYLDTASGKEWELKDVTEEGYVWEVADRQTPIREQIDQVSAGSDNVEKITADVAARLAILELMYRTQVNGNPFTVTFESLTGLVCTGVWNTALNRLEF